MISRRAALTTIAGAAAGILPQRAFSAPQGFATIDLRGSIDAREHAVVPEGGDRQGHKLGEVIARAARQNMPVFLPPGNYQVSNLDLPDGARITGVPGASRLVHSGDGYLIRAEGARRIELSNLVIDGANRRLDEQSPALVQMRGVSDLTIDNCEIIGSRKTAVQIERSGGRIERNRISGAAEYGLFAIESTGLSLTGNTVSDCGNGGILIHRRTKGPDGTIVSGNRIFRIGATNGGTGQYGNAINLFRADDVMVTGNHISQSAFSAIRANSASNIQIANNQCLASGETAIYAEFAFEGAMVSGNIVDGAANGISVVNFNEGGRLATVANNIVRNLKPIGPYVLDEAIFGVGISVEADTAVTGNVIENVPLWGIALGFGPYLRNVIATGNIVRQAGVGCAVTVVEGAGSAMILNNVFEGMKNGAVIGYRWKAPATAELGRGDGQSFRHLTVENNRIV
ncbi:TIGR03808 family TAT-translocated repetitive protein [Neorhizobium sp. CSC1952]|uniref:TIGR03808 family TAT-translocated repetitive protein n=1 Tax=Neorhizobium sp. CSC1952 TaxID=2978974 RepID=UPI0025A60111|nr:TIGR03808 family TAT-translocated repetitive protein [Rhizobium sp. CSC1952]WJR67770.1 TIGR03808 family TAT-translocated repetitive protein [Rhizobium sp. CSC1952]